jgi:hypothetical protein
MSLEITDFQKMGWVTPSDFQDPNRADNIVIPDYVINWESCEGFVHILIEVSNAPSIK